MSSVQCSGCDAMVDPAKAYCPDCGMPMDEEQQRDELSEFDSLLGTVDYVPDDVNDPKAVENKVKSVPLNVPSETRIEPKQPDNRLEIKNEKVDG